MAKKKTNTKVKNDVNFVQFNIEDTPTECNAVTSEVIKTKSLAGIEDTPTECKMVTSEVIKTKVLAGSLNVGSIRTPEDTTGSTIDLKVEGTILSTFNKVTFENMSMDLLLKYKDAVVSLIKDNQHLAEINKGYDYKIYSDATSKINKLNRYLTKINNVIEKNIFDIEIE
jgi:hypothetical protein